MKIFILLLMLCVVAGKLSETFYRWERVTPKDGHEACPNCCNEYDPEDDSKCGNFICALCEYTTCEACVYRIKVIKCPVDPDNTRGDHYRLRPCPSCRSPLEKTHNLEKSAEFAKFVDDVFKSIETKLQNINRNNIEVISQLETSESHLRLESLFSNISNGYPLEAIV